MDGPTALVPHIAAKSQSVDLRLALLAEAQHGVVGRSQLLGLGFTRHTVQDCVTSGRLHRIHRGVYAAGHPNITPKGHWMAAVLACGPEAILSHRRALALWEIREATGGRIEVTVPGHGGRRGPKGILVHSCENLEDADRTVRDGIPVTSLARTLLDYASLAQPQQVRLALEAAERRGFVVGRELEELMARSSRHRGTKKLRSVLAQMKGPAPLTRSELENQFLALIRGSGIPEPQINVIVEGELVDAFWPDQRLIVEVDGYEFHKGRAEFESDRRRDAKLQVAGYRVLRVTKQRMDDEPQAVLSDVRALLGC
jgi:predicted transcriptional regulator of viral defense system